MSASPQTIQNLKREIEAGTRAIEDTKRKKGLLEQTAKTAEDKVKKIEADLKAAELDLQRAEAAVNSIDIELVKHTGERARTEQEMRRMSDELAAMIKKN